MPFATSDFAARRPYLYHLTSRANADRLARSRRLEMAATLMLAAGRADLLRARRGEHVAIEVDGHQLELRDQGPLHPGNVEFEGGWDFEDLVESLNRRVYFWPGDALGPCDYGLRHWERYRTERPALLRVPAAALLRANPRAQLLFCAYNSGSPRCTGGRRSPRGPRTFLPAGAFPRGVGDVVEVTIPGRVELPAEAEQADSYRGPWVPLGETP